MFFGLLIFNMLYSNCAHLDVLSGFNQATYGVHVIAEEVECEQEQSRNKLAHSRMCRGDGAKEPPHFLLHGAIESIAEDNRRYPSDAGFSHTRKIVLNFIEKKFGITGLTINNLCPNNGVSDGFAKTIALLLKKNDVVISFAPTFGLHSRTVNNFGGQVIPIDILDKNNYLPTIAELEDHIIKINDRFEGLTKNAKELLGNGLIINHVPRVKLLNLINPSNPLGKVITDTEENREYYRQVYFLAKKYNFMIFDDLVYWGTEHDPGARAMPFLKAVPEAKDRVIMAFGPSKAIGGARMRAGMLVAPEWFIIEIRKVVLNINSGISAFNQYVMAAAFNMDYEIEREEFLRKNAIEYALRRDVCIVGLLGEQKVLDNPRYGIDSNRIKEIKHVVQLVAYSRLLIEEYGRGVVPFCIQEAFKCHDALRMEISGALESEKWFRDQSLSVKDTILDSKIYEALSQIELPIELHVISYVFYRELKNKSGFAIPSEIIPYLNSVHLTNKLRSLEIPECYKKQVDGYVNEFLQGTKYLKPYSIPEATFFLTIDASQMIGMYAPIDIKKMAEERIRKVKKGEYVPQGKNIIKTPLDSINPSVITSSGEIDLLFSWIGGHNYISGELMNVDFKRGLLRMTYAEPPVIFFDAIDSMRQVEKYVQPLPIIKLWIDVL